MPYIHCYVALIIMTRIIIVAILSIILGVLYYFIRDYELWFGAFAMGLLFTLHDDKSNAI